MTGLVVVPRRPPRPPRPLVVVVEVVGVSVLIKLTVLVVVCSITLSHSLGIRRAPFGS